MAMFLNAIIFKKLKGIVDVMSSDDAHCFATFAPVPVTFTNNDFDFLRTDLDAAELRASYENQMAFSYFANATPRHSTILNVTPSDFIQNGYKTIFQNALLIDSSLRPEQRQAFLKARALLYVNDSLELTPQYEQYISLQSRYLDLGKQVQVLTDKLTTAASNDANAELQKLLVQQRVALNDWIIAGKEDIERALKVVTSLNDRADFRARFLNECSVLDTNIKTLTTVYSDAEFLAVSCLPKEVYDYYYQGWKKVALEEEEINELSVQVRALLGDDVYDTFNVTNAILNRIEFEYLFVPLLRNWFHPDLIDSPLWSFDEAFPDVVSDGCDLKVGLLPAYISQFIFIRRVCSYNKSPQSNTSSPPQATITDTKAFSFRNIAQMRKSEQLAAVRPLEAPIAKVRMLDLNNAVVKPIVRSSGLTPNVLPPAAPSVLVAPHFNFVASATVVRTVQPSVRPELVTMVPVIAEKPTNPPEKTSFDLTICVNDNSNNPVDAISVEITTQRDGKTFAGESDANGTVIFHALAGGIYDLKVQNEEMFEDVGVSISLTSDTTKSVFLTKRTNPKFTMILMAAINVRYRKLPDPLPDHTYS